MSSYVLVGTGGRSIMFKEAFAKHFKDSGKLLPFPVIEFRVFRQNQNKRLAPSFIIL